MFNDLLLCQTQYSIGLLYLARLTICRRKHPQRSSTIDTPAGVSQALTNETGLLPAQQNNILVAEPVME